MKNRSYGCDINSIADIDTNILNPKTGNTEAEMKKGFVYNKKNL